MTQINRRTALSLVAAAGAVGAIATEAKAHAAEDEALRTWWRDRTQAWVKANERQNRLDDAVMAVKASVEKQGQPWIFDGVIEPRIIDLNGPYHCFERRPWPWGTERRLVTYPEAKSLKEAMDLSKERWQREEEAIEKLERSLKRKHRVTALRREASELHKAAIELETQIATAPYVGALGAAVKLALVFASNSHHPDQEPDSGFVCEDNDQRALRMLYRRFVSECGYDPCAEWYGTAGT